MFIFPNVLEASCNESDNLKVFKNGPKVFKVYGKGPNNRYVIDGECFTEFLRAMGEGKDIDIKYADIRGHIDFTNSNFFRICFFVEAEKDLSENDKIYIKDIFGDWKPRIVFVKGNISIENCIIVGNIKRESPGIKVMCIFKSKVCFNGTKFHRGKINFDFAKFNSEAEFKNAMFDEGVSACFNNAKFDSEANFKNVKFVEMANFNRAKFYNEALFNNAEFNAKANFNHAEFKDPVYFDGAKFNSEANFKKAKFYKNTDANFTRAEFNEKATFKNAEFYSLAHFGEVKFVKGINFMNAKFNSQAYFEDVEFHSKTNFINTEFSTANFSWSKFHKEAPAYFENAKFNVCADFSKTEFYAETKFNYAVFHATNDFSDAKFNAKANFFSAHFYAGANFVRAEFFDDCSFNNTLFGMKSTYTEKYLNDLIQSNKVAGIINTMLKELLRKWLSLDKEIKYSPDITISFISVIFTKFVDFSNTFFFGDTDFSDAKFKEVGLFDNAFFFNAKAIGLVDENNRNSLVDLNIDSSYFNLLKGLTFDQVFPNLHKRIKYYSEKKESKSKETIRKRSKENYNYLQENFRKIGFREDADKIYYQMKLLDADNENNN